MAIKKETPAPETGGDTAVATGQPDTVAQAETQEQEQSTTPKKKAAGAVDLIHDIAVEIEHVSKAKALKEAHRLAEDIDTNYFKLGGYLKAIKDNSWFEGKDSFADFVRDEFGFERRKADYLIDIYTNLVVKQIPWDKVKGLGWTKLKAIVRKLTPENVDEWVEKASNLSFSELAKLLAEGGAEGEEKQKTTSDVVKFTFQAKGDQAESINSALSKAKGELNTTFDNVAFEGICLGYLGGNSAVAGGDLIGLLQQAGIDKAIESFNAAYPNMHLSLAEVATPESAEEAVS